MSSRSHKKLLNLIKRKRRQSFILSSEFGVIEFIATTPNSLGFSLFSFQEADVRLQKHETRTFSDLFPMTDDRPTTYMTLWTSTSRRNPETPRIARTQPTRVKDMKTTSSTCRLNTLVHTTPEHPMKNPWTPHEPPMHNLCTPPAGPTCNRFAQGKGDYHKIPPKINAPLPCHAFLDAPCDLNKPWTNAPKLQMKKKEANTNKGCVRRVTVHDRNNNT